MADYVRVCDENSENCIELPCENDGTLLLSTLNGQFPGACGLKYFNESSGTTRGIKLSDGRFFWPGEIVVENTKFICVYPKENKRKAEEVDTPVTKSKARKSDKKCCDLIVLGLPYESTEEEVRNYFTTEFGELQLCLIKTDPVRQRSKGYGFIRFEYYESQLRALAATHKIGGRSCEVRIPASKFQGDYDSSRKIFVGHVINDISENDLFEHFSSYGEVTSIDIPNPSRGFAFVTFLDPDVLRSVFRDEHVVNGVRLRLDRAEPKGSKRNDFRDRNFFEEEDDDYYRDDRRRRMPPTNRRRWNNDDDDYGNYDRFQNNNFRGRNQRSDHPSPPPPRRNRYENHQNDIEPNNGGPCDSVNVPLTPNIVAAALKQAGFGLVKNFQNQPSSSNSFNPGNSYDQGPSPNY